MTDILALLQCIAPLISKTTLRQLSLVVLGMLMMTGRITMLGISRCHTIYNCTLACPREIQITKAIGEVKKALATGSLE